MDTVFLFWGLAPLLMGIGFIFRPNFMVRLEGAYSRRMKMIQGKFFKAHRATGLFFVLVGAVLLLSYFYPVWIYDCFLIARVIAGAVLPQLFEPAATQGLQLIPTYAI